MLEKDCFYRFILTKEDEYVHGILINDDIEHYYIQKPLAENESDEKYLAQKDHPSDGVIIIPKQAVLFFYKV